MRANTFNVSQLMWFFNLEFFRPRRALCGIFVKFNRTCYVVCGNDNAATERDNFCPECVKPHSYNVKAVIWEFEFETQKNLWTNKWHRHSVGYVESTQSKMDHIIFFCLHIHFWRIKNWAREIRLRELQAQIRLNSLGKNERQIAGANVFVYLLTEQTICRDRE